MSNRELAETLADEFLAKGYEWSLNDKTKFVPEADHIEKMLDRIQHRLYTENPDDAGAVEIGRLYVKKSADEPAKADVYLWMGELNA